MDFTIGLGFGGWAILVVGALVVGLLAQFVGEATTGFEWVAGAIAAGLGAVVASEFIVDWRSWGPVFDGLALGPALIGGLVAGIVVEASTRYLTGGTYAGRPVSA